MAVKNILLLGNPKLHEISESFKENETDVIPGIISDLHDTLIDFRKKHGAGRAIAAPQIGVMKRLIYMFIDRPVAFINPKLEDKSGEMIELWDDCMSFPDLMVRVRRHKSCYIKYIDYLGWNEKRMRLEDDLSELLQHEYDHLDGILATGRAIDKRSFSLKSERQPTQ